MAKKQNTREGAALHDERDPPRRSADVSPEHFPPWTCGGCGEVVSRLRLAHRWAEDYGRNEERDRRAERTIDRAIDRGRVKIAGYGAAVAAPEQCENLDHQALTTPARYERARRALGELSRPELLEYALRRSNTDLGARSDPAHGDRSTGVAADSAGLYRRGPEGSRRRRQAPVGEDRSRLQ